MRVAHGYAMRGSALLVLAACRMTPAGGPVPLEGAPADVAALAGTWNGRYWREDERGHGTVAFRLAAGRDTARGVVEMTFAPALQLYGEPATGCDLTRRPCTAIDIAVVRVRGSVVRGTLAPYWNPACDCRTVSAFEGEVRERRIAGTFTTRAESGGAVLLSGRWEIERAPD